MAWILAGLPVPLAVLLSKWTGVISAANTDPTGGWITAFSGLGVASILCAYMAFDNSRLRKELKESTELNVKHDEERAKLLTDMLTRYERLIPIETEGQRIHTESAKVLERAMVMMTDLAARPAIDPSMLSKLDAEALRKLFGGA